MAMDGDTATDITQQLRVSDFKVMMSFTSMRLHCCFKVLGANVSGLVAFANATPFPLEWGEVIPLYFLAPYISATTKVIVLSHPERRYTESVSMIPELLRIGMWCVDS